MAAEDVARALMAMEDDASVCSRLAQGDAGALADLRLSADELALVQEAAAELDGIEVAGFAFSATSPQVRASVYASQGPLSPAVGASFEGFLGGKFGGSIGVMRDQNWAYA